MPRRGRASLDVGGPVALLALLLAVVLAGCAEAPASPSAPEGSAGVVTRLVDGDTVEVDGVRVRLIGVDTPESKRPGSPVECFALQAAAHTAELLPVGTRVRLALDVEPTDRYGRTLAYVFREADGLFVNAALVRDGFANVLTVPPNVRYAGDFVALQREARDAGRGLWSACP